MYVCTIIENCAVSDVLSHDNFVEIIFYGVIFLQNLTYIYLNTKNYVLNSYIVITSL